MSFDWINKSLEIEENELRFVTDRRRSHWLNAAHVVSLLDKLFTHITKNFTANVNRVLLSSQQGNELFTFLADENFLAKALFSNRPNGLVDRKALVISKIAESIITFAYGHRLAAFVTSIAGRANSIANMTLFVTVGLLARRTVIARFEETTDVCNQIKVVLIKKKTDLLHAWLFVSRKSLDNRISVFG